MTLAITLALLLLVGISLGLLGGGGSILTVPILIYAGGMDPKVAIAMSLLIVGVTSAAASVAHARAGRVEWRTAWLFGGAGMAGAYGGGQVARFLPAEVLLLAFGVVMFVTAMAMLRRRAGEPSERPVGERHLGRILAEGAVVGAVTGLVGAGGGFLVVPALVILGGLSMPRAVGTSLVVIALKSFAGLAGYLGHVAIDLRFALPASAIAVAGTLVGSKLVRRIPPETLRRAFGGFVAVMAVVLVGNGLPAALREAAWFRAVFVERWPLWAGGAALAALLAAFALHRLRRAARA